MAESMLASLNQEKGDNAQQLDSLLQNSEGDGNFILED